MKSKLYSLLFLLCALATATATAQIPNSGFENWTSAGTYLNPDNWKTGNDFINYPATRDPSHYPATVGNYSIRIESNTGASGLNGLGVVSTDTVPPNISHPAFSITGHPTALTGYYKYAPLNGDEMQIAIELFQGGVSVANGLMSSNATTANWTPFNISLSSYTNADSATIYLSAYNASGFFPQYHPAGNSVLNIDNLNFDNLISGISNLNEAAPVSVFPNPFSTQLTFSLSGSEQTTISLYDFLGQQVLQQTFTNSATINTAQLAVGIYFYELRSNKVTLKTGKLVKQ